MTKNIPFFPILHVFAPLNDVRAYIAWSWKTTLITWIFLRGWYPTSNTSGPPPRELNSISPKCQIRPYCIHMTKFPLELSRGGGKQGKDGRRDRKGRRKYVTRHSKTGQLSVTKKSVTFLLSERALTQRWYHSCVNWMQLCNFVVKNKS